MVIVNDNSNDRTAEATMEVDQINVKDLLATMSVEELNATAEAYYASIVDPSHHLSKPFGALDECFTHLVHLEDQSCPVKRCLSPSSVCVRGTAGLTRAAVGAIGFGLPRLWV